MIDSLSSREIAQLDKLLLSLPSLGPHDGMPLDLRHLGQAVTTNYLLAAILIELRGIAQNLPST